MCKNCLQLPTEIIIFDKCGYVITIVDGEYKQDICCKETWYKLIAWLVEEMIESSK
jgi:hypothetical protein